MLIPQAWSLGLEATFYLIAPAIILLGKKYLRLLFSISFVFFLLAYFGVLNTDLFGYRLLPGTLWIFILGISISLNSRKVFNITIVVLIFIATVAAFTVDNLANRNYNREVLIGVLFFIIFIQLYKVVSADNFMRYAGYLSYGIFLNHYFILNILKTTNWLEQNRYILFLTTLLLSTIVSHVSFKIIESPVSTYRRKIRSKH